MLSGSAESRSTSVVRRTAELLASDAPLADLFPAFARELAGLFGASAVNLAIGVTGTPLFLYKDGVVVPPADLTRVRAAFGGEVAASARAVAVPLPYGRDVIGAVGIRADDATSYDDEDVDTLRACALYLAVRVHEEQLREERDQLAVLAGTDPLTGIANRRAFDERLEEEWRRAQREGSPLGAVMVDIDLFKSFNDRYGHLAGDVCLKRVAAALRDAARRPGDFLARVGGEEFCAILPGADIIGATTIAETMRAAIAAQAIPHDDNPRRIVTITCGAACTRPVASGDPKRLIAAADDGLYAAKRGGRDRVSTAPDPFAPQT
ncbi:MAG: diguanylate cyclase response regulator [Candidatus Eremiobacteraeota bacterium]|jgi:diguanylate cyclase (GGDEF)-like protein|nr:diguanylate cyclase response regulator [Candidatus Eremiobacteraeota bacterium]